MRVGIFQFSPAFGDVSGNLQRIEAALSAVEADLIVLPELCTTGYQFVSHEEVVSLCEPVPEGPSVQRLIALARKRHLFLVAGIGEKADDRLYNAAILVGPEGFIGTYRKVHLFDKERTWFTPGDLGFPVFEVGKVRIGMMICFDWLFPEAARTLTLRGADLICHPANLVLPYCPDAMVTRAIENGVYCLTANRTGEEARLPDERLVYIGKSQVVSPRGDLLFRMGRETALRVVEIDPAISRDKRIHRRNHRLDDRRPEWYTCTQVHEGGSHG